MSEQTQFVRSMVSRFPSLHSLLEEHIKDNYGEMLPHVFFGELTRYVLSLSFAASKSGLSPQRELQDILDYLEDMYSSGDQKVQELISVSFLENLPRQDEPGAQVRKMVGPNLRRQLDVIG